MDTDWPKIISALTWANDFKILTQDVSLSDDFVNNITQGMSPIKEEVRELQNKYSNYLVSMQKLLEHIDADFNDNNKNMILEDCAIDEIGSKIARSKSTRLNSSHSGESRMPSSA